MCKVIIPYYGLLRVIRYILFIVNKSLIQLKQHPFCFCICGFNITIIAAFFTLIFSRLLGERRGAFVSALGTILFTLLVGANPAVVRAVILGLLTIFGHRSVSTNLSSASPTVRSQASAPRGPTPIATRHSP